VPLGHRTVGHLKREANTSLVAILPGRSRIRVGLLTIGQAPRHDSLAREVRAILGEAIRVVERGALDGLNGDDLAALGVALNDGFPLTTQMADGRAVVVDERALVPLLNAQIHQLEDYDDAEATLLMCTGRFPELSHRRPLLQPHSALFQVVAAIAGDHQLVSLTPLAQQLEPSRRNWLCAGVAGTELMVADPYGADPIGAVTSAAEAARAGGAEFLYMDCFGYDLAMKDAARRAFQGPVVLARSLAARLFAEIIA